MKKSGLIIIAILAVVLAALTIYVNGGNSTPKMSSDNLKVVTAPDQKEVQTHPMFTPFVYEPKKMEGTNVALEGRVNANGYTDVYPASEAINGSAEGGSYWEGPSDQSESILDLNLKKAYNIHAMKIMLNPNQIWGKRTQTLKIETSEDGKTFKEWIPLQDFKFDPKTGNEVVIDKDLEGFTETKTQYLRVTITKNTGANAGQIGEFEVYTKDK
jgi:hypothetical protein